MNPYEPPAVMDSKSVDHPIEVFRSSLPFVILTAIGANVPIAIFLLAFPVPPDPPFLIRLYEIATYLILTIFLYALLVVYFKIYFYSDRIRGYTFWGTYHDLALIDVERVNSIGFLGIRYIRVYSRHGTRVMWIPLFLKNLDRFVNLINQYAEPNNVLVLYFKSIGMVSDEEGRWATNGN